MSLISFQAQEVVLFIIIIGCLLLFVVYLEFLERTSNYLIMPRCDDCNSDAIDLSTNPVPFGEYFHNVAHVSVKKFCIISSAY